MAAAFLLAVFGASHVAAQMEHSNSIFAYLGCASVNLPSFGSPVACQDGHVTPEACQDACRGHQFAAVLPDACYCGDHSSTITIIEEHFCNVSCMGKPASGKCGGFDLDHGCTIANAYHIPGSPEPEHVFSVSLPSPATRSPRYTSGQLPSPRATTILVITGGSAPEFPIFSLTHFPVSLNHFPEQTSCSQHGHSVTEVPIPHETFHASSKGASGLHASSNGASGLPACDNGDTTAPCATDGPHSSGYPSGGEAHPPPGCGDIGGSDKGDCTPRPAELSKAPSQRTHRPAAPYASIPSEFQEDGATHGRCPSLSMFGGLALIAAMIM